MLKKISTLLIISVIALVLAACTESQVTESPPVVEVANISTEAIPTAAPLADAPAAEISIAADVAVATGSYPIVDTGQNTCYDASGVIICPTEGEAFYGQDAQTTGNKPNYTNNGDGTVTDNVTGLIWQQSADTNGDGSITAADKMSYADSVTYCENLSYAGQTDWQLPTIKQLYSLIDFSGVDPSGYNSTDVSGLIPFIDTDYFDFAYGDTNANERIIDAQYASSTLYVGDGIEQLLFGVNFADGRIKGYGLTLHGQDKTFDVACVRETGTYGVNDFVDNTDSTITDNATGLMWAQNDSGSDAPGGLNWGEALAYVTAQNAANYLGYNDWRLPNVKELQSLVDYSRSPDTTDSAAIDPLFNTTPIINEAGETDYSFYWSSTTHSNWTNNPGSAGAYVSFGRAMGYMNSAWNDVHGAGAQRSDPKSGDSADYPEGNGPQGDAIRIYNTVRLVRGGNITVTPAEELVTSTPAVTVQTTNSAQAVQPAQPPQSTGQQGQDAPPPPPGNQQQPGAPSPSDGMQQPGGQPQGPGGSPPTEAVDACSGQSEGATCQFTTPHGEITGTCAQIEQQLACVPEGGPPPPPGQ